MKRRERGVKREAKEVLCRRIKPLLCCQEYLKEDPKDLLLVL